MAEPNTTPAAAGAGYAVLTPERVRLQYDVAGIGSRSAAALVDLGILAVIVGALYALSFGALVFRQGWLGIAGAIVAVVGIFLVPWAYFLMFELAWSGQTPGKRTLGIRVIRENGYPLRAIDAVIRNVVRIVDGPPFGALIGLLTMLLNRRSKRLGDFAAGTIVVREARPMSLVATATTGTIRTGIVLNASDATLVRDFLSRRQRMDGQARASLASRLAQQLARRYGLAPPTADEPFLESLADG